MATDIIARGMAANAGSGGSADLSDYYDKSEIDSRFGDSETYPIGGALDKAVWVKVGEFDFKDYSQLVLHVENNFYSNRNNLLGIVTLSKSGDIIEGAYIPMTISLKTGENNFRAYYYNGVYSLYTLIPANDRMCIEMKNSRTVKLFHENDVYNSASQLPTPSKQLATLCLPLNNLEGTTVYRPLAANQGRLLNEKITALQNTITALCEANGLTIPETMTAQTLNLEVDESETEENTDDEI